MLVHQIRIEKILLKSRSFEISIGEKGSPLREESKSYLVEVHADALLPILAEVCKKLISTLNNHRIAIPCVADMIQTSAGNRSRQGHSRFFWIWLLCATYNPTEKSISQHCSTSSTEVPQRISSKHSKYQASSSSQHRNRGVRTMVTVGVEPGGGRRRVAGQISLHGRN